MRPSLSRPRGAPLLRSLSAPAASKDRLFVAWENETLCLCLGSGIGVDVKLPNWSQLTFGLGQKSGIFPSLSDSELQSAREALLRPPPDLTFWLETFEPKAASLVELLYSGTSLASTEDWVTGPSFEESAPHWAALLAIAIAARSPDRPFHVISYNFDVLLEESIAALGQRAEILAPESHYRLVEPRGGVSSPYARHLDPGRATVRVLHPHGVCFRDGTHSPKLMLTAADYDHAALLGLQPFSLHQIHAFAHLNCLFYGFSFADDLVRKWARLGDWMKRAVRPSFGLEDARHIALLQREERAPLAGGATDPVLKAASTRADFALEQRFRAALAVELAARSGHEEAKGFVRDLALRLLGSARHPLS
jgi:hypothetical protein